jgi:hypothetical protein
LSDALRVGVVLVGVLFASAACGSEISVDPNKPRYGEVGDIDVNGTRCLVWWTSSGVAMACDFAGDSIPAPHPPEKGPLP